VLAETLVASVATVVLTVILGLRFIDGDISGSSTQNNPFLNAVTSTFFLALLLVLIFIGVAVVELIYHRKRPTVRSVD
jgi:cell division protein FtsX